MFEVSAHRANTGMQTPSPFVHSNVDNVLLQIDPDFNQLLLEFIDILQHRLIDLLLRDLLKLVIDWTEVIAVGAKLIQRDEVWGFMLQQSIVSRAQCTVLLIHKRLLILLLFFA